MSDEFEYSIVSDKLQSYASSEDHEAEATLLSDVNRRYTRSSRLRRWMPWIAHGTTPILEAIDHDFQEVTFNGSLWYQSPYKGPPTSEVNKAWRELNRYGTISVTEADILAVGHPSTSVQFPKSAGGGYLAVAMGTHHLHCLHWIWQNHHSKFFPEFQRSKEKVPEMYDRHFEHCIDYLRQGIMCNSDTGIIPYNWVLDLDQPTPNANTVHKCVNWDALQGWLKNRAVEIPEGYEWKQPPDAVSLSWNP